MAAGAARICNQSILFNHQRIFVFDRFRGHVERVRDMAMGTVHSVERIPRTVPAGEGFQIDVGPVVFFRFAGEYHRTQDVVAGSHRFLGWQKSRKGPEHGAGEFLARRGTGADRGRIVRVHNGAFRCGEFDRVEESAIRRQFGVEERLDRVCDGRHNACRHDVVTAARLRTGAGEIEMHMFAFNGDCCRER